jgi:L-iditol 2-dehydrogenase
LVKVKAAGICGSDVQRVYGDEAYHYPIILGHEFAGEIVEVTQGVDASMLGKDVAIFPLLPCKKCDVCEKGEYASCRNYSYFGSRYDGGFREYVAVPIWNIVPLPKGVTYEEAAMIEPSAIALHALSQCGIKIGYSILIFGAGPIGIMLGMLARIWGASNVIMLDIDKKKIDFAKQLGFEYVIDNSDSTYTEKIKEITGGQGVDVAIDGVGLSSTLSGCIQIVKPLGNIVCVGNFPEDMTLTHEIFTLILRKQLHIIGTWNSGYTQDYNEWTILADLMAKKKYDVRPLISHKFTFEDVKEAFALLKEKKEYTCKVLFVEKL